MNIDLIDFLVGLLILLVIAFAVGLGFGYLFMQLIPKALGIT